MATIKNSCVAYLLGATVLASMAVACSGGATSDGSPSTRPQDTTAGDDSSSGSDDTSTDDTTSSGSKGSTGTTGGTSARDGGVSTGDAATKADSAPADWGDTETITLQMDDFVVPAGSEVFSCQQIGNPFGKDVDITSMDGTMSTGSHHFFLFDMDATTARTTPAPLMPCPGGGLEFHPFPYLSQQPHFVQTMPDGFGYPINTDHGLMFNVHYLNASSKDVTSHVYITLKVQKQSLTKTHVGTIFMNNTFFAVPPTPKATPGSYSASSTPLYKDYSIMTSWSHMHQWGVDFRAVMNGQQFYEEKNWDEPQLFQHSPPLAVKGGTSISWTCDYYNDTGKVLTFGDSAQNNVMCIYFGWYYPADPANPGIVTVLQ